MTFGKKIIACVFLMAAVTGAASTGSQAAEPMSRESCFSQCEIKLRDEQGKLKGAKHKMSQKESSDFYWACTRQLSCERLSTEKQLMQAEIASLKSQLKEAKLKMVQCWSAQSSHSNGNEAILKIFVQPAVAETGTGAAQPSSPAKDIF